MSVEAVLTVVTVILAVMALIPSERAHDLKIRLGLGTRAAAVVASACVVYWSLLEQVHALPLIEHLPRPIRWYANWRPDSLSLVALLSVGVIGYLEYRRKLPVYRVPALSDAVADALARRRYAECIHLLETHLASIVAAHHGEYWQDRLRRKIAPEIGELLMRLDDEPKRTSLSSWWHKWRQSRPGAPTGTAVIAAGGAFFHDLPQRPAIVERYVKFAEGPKHAAQDLLRAISLTPALAKEIAIANPYLGVRMQSIASTWVVSSFAADYARALLTDPDSVLYRELRRSENIDANGWLGVDPQEQPLIAALCEDAASSDGPNLVYTYLYAGIDPIRVENAGPLSVVLNSSLGDFHERGRWTSPPFATVYLLQIIAPRLAANPAVPVLNLYVVKSLVDVLLAQSNPADDIDLMREWPTPTHYLLYESVSTLTDLVRSLNTASNQAVAPTAPGHPLKELTLPLHAIDVLGAVMYECMKTAKLDGHFKSYLLEVWWRAYAEKYKGQWVLSDRVLEAFAVGGGSRRDLGHQDGVAEALSGIDLILRVGESADKFRERFGV